MTLASTDSAPLTAAEVLQLLPQKPPFRFLDQLLEIGPNGAIGAYTFTGSESFYEGHFPGDPVTPGVILLETMCQTGLVALGIYLLGLETSRFELLRTTTLFTDAQVEFERVVRPGSTVHVHAERVLWRRRKLRARVRLLLDDGILVAHGTVAGVGVSLTGATHAA